MISTCDLAGYIKLAEKILNEERVRLRTYLTWDKIDEKVELEFQKEVLIRYQTEIFESNNALIKLFNENRFEDLSLLFKLY